MYSSSTLAVVKPSVLYIAIGFISTTSAVDWLVHQIKALAWGNPRTTAPLDICISTWLQDTNSDITWRWIINNTWWGFQLVVTTDINLDNWMWILWRYSVWLTFTGLTSLHHLTSIHLLSDLISSMPSNRQLWNQGTAEPMDWYSWL